MTVARPPTVAPHRSSLLALEVDDQVSPMEWDEQIRRLDGCLYHTSAWSEYRAFDGAQPLFFRWSDAETGELAALAVGTRRPPLTSRAGRLASYVHIESPPATRRTGADFAGPVRRWASAPARRPRLIEVRLGSFDARSAWAPTAPPRPVHRVEFVVPARAPADVLAPMRTNTRRLVRRAQRQGVDVRVGCESDELLAFAHLYGSTGSRLLEMKGIAPRTEQPEAHAAALQVLARRGAARLYLARLDGEPIAGCLFGVWNGGAYYLQNGADDRARTCGAVHAVLHQAISDFATDGFDRVNLGGVPAEAEDESSIDHGLYHFKSGFGTEPVRCVGGSLVLRPSRVRALTFARRQRERLRALRRRP